MATTVNVIEFKGHLKAFQGLTERQAVAGQKKITLQCLRGCIRANPRDTGRMQNAWVVAVGGPTSDDPTAGRSGPFPSGNVTGAITAGGTTLAGLKFGQASFVCNNTEYSGHVNNNHPTKAHFVEAVVANVEGQFAGGGA